MQRPGNVYKTLSYFQHSISEVTFLMSVEHTRYLFRMLAVIQCVQNRVQSCNTGSRNWPLTWLVNVRYTATGQTTHAHIAWHKNKQTRKCFFCDAASARQRSVSSCLSTGKVTVETQRGITGTWQFCIYFSHVSSELRVSTLGLMLTT